MEHLTANQILNIPISMPENLFREATNLDPKMVTLSHEWQSNSEVMGHIILLYKAAKSRIKEGTWEDAESVIITIPSLGEKKFNYLRKHTFELGRIYVGSKHVVFFLTKESDDARIIYSYANNYFKFLNVEIEKRTKPYLPEYEEVENTQGEKGFCVPKSNNVLLLKDVNTHFNGNIPIPHVLWITSRCMHYATWLESNNIMYGGFFQDSLFINPDEHTVSLLGGWWYSHIGDKKLKIASSKFLDAVPHRLIGPGLAKPIMDRYLIRRLICELLGDPTGNSLIRNKNIPTPIEQWLNMPPATKAKEDYINWYAALEAAYGKRTFTQLKLTENDLYR